MKYEITGCKRTPEETKAWPKMSKTDRESVMARCKASPWGTKCQACLRANRPTHNPIDDLPEAPF